MIRFGGDYEANRYDDTFILNQFTFKEPRVYQPPRSFQLGVRMTF